MGAFPTFTGTSLLAPLLVIPLAVSASAGSGSPHFLASATSFSGTGSTVTVTFEQAGLPAGSSRTVVVSAQAATTYECVYGDGLDPSAANRRTFTTDVSTSGAFTADRGGRIVGWLTLAPPSATSLGFACPQGQGGTFVSVSYASSKVTDTSGGPTAGVHGAYSWINSAAPGVG